MAEFFQGNRNREWHFCNDRKGLQDATEEITCLLIAERMRVAPLDGLAVLVEVR